MQTLLVPRLLYIGDVPVETSYHGSALLYRLLQRYPPEDLLVIESNLSQSQPDRRLPHIRYARVRLGYARPLRTRFAAWYSSWLTLTASRRSDQVRAALGAFHPEAVLTVMHGYLWGTAARFAASHELPLHVICHDDWPRFTNVVGPLHRQVDIRFCEVYRQAASRLCVSPVMLEEYARRYGVRGTLLYPTRAADAPEFREPPERLSEKNRPLVFAFGGSINTAGHIRALRQLSEALTRIRAELHLFSPISEREAERQGLLQDNVRFCGLVPAREFIPRMRASADVLFAPTPFAEDHSNVSLFFPSKLTDYTAAGLPILIYGPEHSSVVRWARQNPDAAVIVATEGVKALSGAVDLLASPRARLSFALGALRVGERFFSHEAGESIFVAALKRKLASDTAVL